jgi:hypothetical protein
MFLALTVACLITANPASTQWFDAKDLSSGTIEIQESADYIAWVWDDRKASRLESPLTIDKTQFSLPKSRKSDTNYIWHKLDSIKLKSGKHSIAISDTVARVILTTDTAYDPERAMKHTYVLDTPDAVKDRRAQSVKHTDTVFIFPEFSSIGEWESKADTFRRRILLSSGLWPLPEKTPLYTKIFDRIQHSDYSIEKVHFQAWPGYFVTGSLYRPVGDGPFPAVYCPHGHWEEGRLVNTDKNSVPGRAITLARMGAVVFTVDMVGYNDSTQFEHRWSKDEYKLWGIHPFALQLWGGIRALDFLEGLPDVDPEKLGVTGASGGGTQTFALMAVDPRVKVAAPVNMISSTMQGGCVCENAPLIRYENSNMEIGALMAPRPLLMVSATGDWTRETPHVEFPALRSIYDLYGATDNIENVHIDSGHNYNQQSREAMYRFFGKHLIDPSKDWSEYTEPPFQVGPEDEMRFFTKGSNDHDSSDQVVATIQEQLQSRADDHLKKISNGNQKLASQYRQALQDTLGVSIPQSNDLTSTRTSLEEFDTYVLERRIIGRKIEGDAIPALLYRAKIPTPQDTVILVGENGKQDFTDPSIVGPSAIIQKHIDQGKAVLLIDPFLIGEHNSPSSITLRVRIGGFMDTFQPTDTANRIQDILTATSYIRSRRDMTGNIQIAGHNNAAVWVKFATALDPTLISENKGKNTFDRINDTQWVEQFYIPSIRTLGGLQLADVLSK